MRICRVRQLCYSSIHVLYFYSIQRMCMFAYRQTHKDKSCLKICFFPFRLLPLYQGSTLSLSITYYSQIDFRYSMKNDVTAQGLGLMLDL